MTGVGAILLFFCGCCLSSRSDSLVPPISRFPRKLLLTEPELDIGVIGGVYKGSPAGPELLAVTLGTLPIVGVGSLITLVAGVCAKEKVVATDEVEFDLLGLTGRPIAGDWEGASMDEEGFAGEEAVAPVGVGNGEGWVEFDTEIAKEGCCAVGA